MTQGVERSAEEIAKMKADMIVWLEESVKGTFSQACMTVGLSRREFYRWREEDAEWSKTMDAARAKAGESGLDFIEGQLMKLIQEGNVASVIFALKCLGRGRGWIEKQDVTFDGNLKVTHEASREYLFSKLFSDASPGSPEGETIEAEPTRSLPAPL